MRYVDKIKLFKIQSEMISNIYNIKRLSHKGKNIGVIWLNNIPSHIVFSSGIVSNAREDEILYDQ